MSLPRLLYVGDVPVEPTVAGAALLYRLFDGYPADRLIICQSDLGAVRSPERQLRGVAYHRFSLGPKRLLYSRLSGYYSAWMLAQSGLKATALAAQLGRAPQAVVTVAHAFSWLTAARLAQRYGVPLHLIVHDECLTTMGLAPPVRGYAERRFEWAYRLAAKRYCISPAMRDHYFRRYGVESEVLYPSQAAAARIYTAPAARVSQRSGPFTVAFAGSLNLGHIDPVERIATALRGLGGRLEIYGSNLAPELQSRLASPVISFHPFLPSGELSERLRERADVLLMPMSFDAVDAQNMELCFPAKLADYTAMGLPILVVGPPYGAAVRWARENPGVAAMVTEIATPELPRVLTTLADDATLRRNLATEALRVGRTFFGHAQAQERFFAGIAPRAVPAVTQA